MPSKSLFTFGQVAAACLFAFLTPQAAAEPDYEAMFDERLKSVVVVELFVQRQIDREPVSATGAVIDEEGRIILIDSALPSWFPPEWFKDIRVRPPGEDVEGVPATYLGQDFLTGFHFVQMDEGAENYTPVTHWGQAELKRGQFLWGIAVMDKQWHFAPYYLSGRLAAIEKIPWDIGFTTTPATSPGSLVFDEQGRVAGWGGRITIEEKILVAEDGRQLPIGLKDTRDTAAFLAVDTFMEQIQRIPTEPIGDPRPYLGTSGLQPVTREVAQFLGLENQGAVVVSDIIEASPADKAGLKSKDIIVKLDGEPLPKRRPDFIVTRHFDNEISRHAIGDTITLTVIRGDEEQDISITLDKQPKVLKEALRAYYDELGLGIREFILLDGVARRELRVDVGGVVVDFIKPNSKANTAKLEPGDWIKEIDGTKINSFAQAEQIFDGVASDTGKAELVLLVERNNETKVLRVKLK